MTGLLTNLGRKTPYGEALQLLSNKDSETIFSYPVRVALQKHNLSNSLEFISHHTGNFIASYRERYSLDSQILSAKIAENLGCKVIARKPQKSEADTIAGFVSTGPLTGSMYVLNGQFVIRISPGSLVQVIRQTIAHEIIHTLFYTKDKGRPGGLPPAWDEEVLCEYGAAQLLLPDDIISSTRQTQQIPIKPSSILQISKKHQLPYRIVCQRLIDPIMHPNTDPFEAVVCWKLRKGSKEVRYEDVVPCWSITRHAFIPLGGKCHVKNEGVIYQSFISDTPFVEEEQVEEVEIGTLKGRFLVLACAHGKIQSGTRYVLSIFRTV